MRRHVSPHQRHQGDDRHLAGERQSGGTHVDRTAAAIEGEKVGHQHQSKRHRLGHRQTHGHQHARRGQDHETGHRRTPSPATQLAGRRQSHTHRHHVDNDHREAHRRGVTEHERPRGERIKDPSVAVRVAEADRDLGRKGVRREGMPGDHLVETRVAVEELASPEAPEERECRPAGDRGAEQAEDGGVSAEQRPIAGSGRGHVSRLASWSNEEGTRGSRRG